MAHRKWNKEGIPHKGWTHQGVTDLGVPTFTCEMCDQEEIRFVHHLEHPTALTIDVGCVCAERMTEDYFTPKKLERRAKGKAQADRKRAMAAQPQAAADRERKMTELTSAEGDAARARLAAYIEASLRIADWCNP